MQTYPQPATLSFFQALRFWLKLGFISFGGPAGQIAIMHKELVEERAWISEKRFLHALNYCMVLPGPEAQQLATYIGWLLHGSKGGVVAGLLFVLPSLLILIALSWVYSACGQQAWVMGLFYGIKPAVAALVVQATHRIGSRTLRNPSLWMVAVAAFIALAVLDLPFPFIVLAAAGVGYLGGRCLPQHFSNTPKHAKTTATPSQRKALIDDDSVRPDHARFRWSSLMRVLLVGALLWSLPMLALLHFFGWSHALTQMAWFFTKAALLTFGGAYAVLPYVMQAAVEDYRWLSPSQMMDGLALGETTPGPLIMVLAFVGFVGSYGLALFGADHLFLAGATAAILVTWFTFLPSFIFILAGAPLIEASHEDVHLTAPLNAITAAVVGVIANLALFFAFHVIWPEGFTHAPDFIATGMSLAAAIALLRYRVNVVWVIAVCALLGWFLRSLN